MGKSRVPFKTNVNRSSRVPTAKPSGGPANVRNTNDGYWLSPRSRPIKAYLVDEKKERKKLSKWILIWTTGIPLSFMAMLWLVLLFTDLFTS
jgi:hypothetical protein